jgi:hypothetical protein
MSDIGIDPEDRKRLARMQFGEWFDEFFAEKFGEAFDKKFQEARSGWNAQRNAAVPVPSGQQGQPVQPQATPAQPLPRPQRRRSLLEECFSQTFGL